MVVNGRGNDGVISLHPLMYALDAKGDMDKFYDLLAHFTDMALDIAYDYRQKLNQRQAKSNPLVFVEGGGWTKLDPEETIEKALEGFTTSIGYIGLWETMNVLDVPTDLETRQRVQNEILSFIKARLEERKAKDGIMYSFYSTPSESLCYTFMNKIKAAHPEYVLDEQDEESKDIDDNLFETNSFHFPTWKHIGFKEKIEYEAPSHQIANAGHISYVEIANGMETATIEQIVVHAMQRGMYFGINFISSYCNHCHHRGDFQLVCPECASHDIDTKNRVCGYLAAQTTHGQFRENPGKIDEVSKRVRHVGTRGQMKSYFETTGETLLDARA
jgi:ribonucleoside-triphosphate reductase